MYTVVDSDGMENKFEDYSYAMAFANLHSYMIWSRLYIDYDCVLKRVKDGEVFTVYGKERLGFSIYDRPLWTCNLRTCGTPEEVSSVEVGDDCEKKE